jgi:hypothetical protein
VYSDIPNWNMCDSRVEGGGFTTTSDNSSGRIDYRWLDSPNKTTVISANGYFTDGLYGTAEVPAGATDYRFVANRGGGGLQFRLWGRTAIGSGCMYDHDGRVLR